jgi:copper chaperone NosL
MRKLLRLFLILPVFLAACAAGEIKPEPIEAGDMCSFCKMAISEKRFAAEIITDDERVLKFDDIGCLLRYRQQAGSGLKSAAVYVTDYDSREWLKADAAFFVKSKTIKTPMGSGITAFADRSKAGSESLRFDALSVPEK